MSINTSNSSRRRGNSTTSQSNGSSKSHSWRNSKPGGLQKQHSNKFQNSSPRASKSSNNNEVASAAAAATAAAGKQGKGTPGLFWAVARLLVILAKGLVAVVIFVVLFNLALVVINKTLLGGKLAQYIDTPSWKDILGRRIL